MRRSRQDYPVEKLSRWRVAQYLLVDVLMWTLFPRACSRSYRVFRGGLMTRLDSFHSAGTCAGSNVEAQELLARSFAHEMAIAWGEDEGWLDRYKDGQ